MHIINKKYDGKVQKKKTRHSVSCVSVLLETMCKLKASVKPHLCVAACQLAQGVCVCVYNCVYGK